MAELLCVKFADNEFKFNKAVLSNNSQYFRNLFEGDWVGKDENKLTLQDAKIPGATHLFSSVMDPTYNITDQFVLDVLIEAIKFQFTEIIKSMQTRVLSVLSPMKCLDIWFKLRPYHAHDKITTGIYLKAKAMALDEFTTIKDNNEIINSLSMENLRLYLGQTGLRADSEIQVFKTAMKWLNANVPKVGPRVDTDILWKLLKCLDLNSISADELQYNIIVHNEIIRNMEVVTPLTCFMDMKREEDRLIFFNSDIKQEANSLKRSKKRHQPKGPCILVEEIKAVQTSETKLGDSCVIYFDERTRKFRKLVAIDDQLIGQLDGYGLIACQESVYLFGGMETDAHPRCTCWEYNNFRKDWKLRTSCPPDMNYFEACTVKDKIFAAAGAHTHAWIRQYNPIIDKWSDRLKYAPSPEQIRTCALSDQCLIFDVKAKNIYLINDTCSASETIALQHNTALPHKAEELGCFYYNGSFYIKGYNVVKTDRLQSELFKEISAPAPPIVNREYPLTWDRLELVLCNNIVYTLYQFPKPNVVKWRGTLTPEELEDELCSPRLPKNFMYSLERFNMDTYEKDYVFQNVSDENGIDINGVKYTVAPVVKLFGFNYYNFGHEDKLVFPIDD